jgi:hypothetical protein
VSSKHSAYLRVAAWADSSNCGLVFVPRLAIGKLRNGCEDQAAWNWQRWDGIQRRGVDRYTDHAAVALTEAVMRLGGGDRFFLWDAEKT